MATRQSTVDFVLEQIASVGGVTAKKLFGEYGLYCDGRIVALICDDQLFVKPTTAGKAFVGRIIEAAPYPGAKPCLLISGDQIEDAKWLSKLIKISTAELPLPKKKARKKPEKFFRL